MDVMNRSSSGEGDTPTLAQRRAAPGCDERRRARGRRAQSAVPAIEVAGGALVGADELSRALGVVGADSAEDYAAILECLDDGASPSRLEFRLMAELL